MSYRYRFLTYHILSRPYMGPSSQVDNHHKQQCHYLQLQSLQFHDPLSDNMSNENPYLSHLLQCDSPKDQSDGF